MCARGCFRQGLFQQNRIRANAIQNFQSTSDVLIWVESRNRRKGRVTPYDGKIGCRRNDESNSFVLEHSCNFHVTFQHINEFCGAQGFDCSEIDLRPWEGAFETNLKQAKTFGGKRTFKGVVVPSDFCFATMHPPSRDERDGGDRGIRGFPDSVKRSLFTVRSRHHT